MDCNGNGNYSGGTKVRSCGIKWDNTISKGSSMFGKYAFSYLLSSPGFTSETYWLDLNGWLDGQNNGGLDAYGTADIYINGSLVAANQFAWWGIFDTDEEYSNPDHESEPLVTGTRVFWYYAPLNENNWTYVILIDGTIKASQESYDGEGWISYTLDSTTLEKGWHSICMNATCGSTTKSVENRFYTANHFHDYEAEITCAPTCKAEGVRTFICTCGDSYTQTVAINPNNHVDTTDVDAIASTCSVKGYSAGVYCNDCERFISGHVEQVYAAHQLTIINAKTATCTEAGYTGDIYCTACQQTLASGSEVEPLPKPEEPSNLTDPTNPTNPTEPTNPTNPTNSADGKDENNGKSQSFFQRLMQWFKNLLAKLFGR